MSGTPPSPRRATIVPEPSPPEGRTDIALLCLRLALMGCAAAFVAALCRVAWVSVVA